MLVIVGGQVLGRSFAVVEEGFEDRAGVVPARGADLLVKVWRDEPCSDPATSISGATPMIRIGRNTSLTPRRD